MSSPVIVGHNIVDAWLKAFKELLEPGVSVLNPLCVSIMLNNENEEEVEWFEQTLDLALKNARRASIQTTANTIFPSPLYNPESSRKQLYERYYSIIPPLKSFHGNHNGIYFERLIAYGSEETKRVNQLEHVIETFSKGNKRRSALQATVFDPLRDHTDQRQRGFPCLQLVSFTPLGKNEMTITGIYATQYIFDRAYGNYVGLYHLGQFMAREMGLNLTQLNCIVTNAKLGSITKEQGKVLLESLEDKTFPLLL